MWNQIPDTCEVTYSGRFRNQFEYERVMKELKVLFEVSTVEGTRCEAGSIISEPVFEQSDENIKLLRLVNETAAEMGYGTFNGVFLGGSSDACYIAANGIPVLCSCGVCGEWNHTDREYAVVESIFERAKLWTAVVWNL